MPTATTTTTAPSPHFHIPTVDISPYLHSPSSPAARDIVHQVRQACITSGFFQLIGHGIPRELQEQVFRGSAAFFNLPFEEKAKLDKAKSIGASNRGYEIIGNQVLQEGTLPDLKEGFYISQDIPASDPRVQANAFLLGPNIWPPSSLLPSHIFKTPMETYYTHMFQLSLHVLSILAAGLSPPHDPEIFTTFTSNDAVASLRLLHYPPQPPSSDEKQLGAGAHTDFGAITLLLQDSVGGLQVWDKTAANNGGGVWVDVVPDESAYVVNVGDMLEMWTAGEYKSTLHRVINRSGKDRYSVPFFFDGNLDCELRVLGAGKEEEGDVAKEVLTVEGHMRERFASTYGKGKKAE